MPSGKGIQKTYKNKSTVTNIVTLQCLTNKGIQTAPYKLLSKDLTGYDFGLAKNMYK